ncbi:UDP-3-O-[3-hydroxymyristoyl] glucosamine N-acyltransferase [hydrothermal vent metagenome]|uniref:UDP-3-O-[3-hydroxymyristoyl] glucosamine N-acyltransferase n=1 Tax=hydrothermal vent metagenome TaxID=652676 RepID=A0A3B1D9Y6_9ZZZZ
MKISLKKISKCLDGQIIGNEDLLLEGLASIDEATVGQVTFVSHPKYEKKAKETKASVVMTRKVIKGLSTTFLIVEDPYFSFAKLLTLFHPPRKKTPGVHASATLGEHLVIGTDAVIGPSVTLEDGVTIESNAQIGAGVFVGEGSSIGENSIIYPNVTILEGVKIGKRVIIHSGSVIGSDGFGFAFHGGKHHKIPQTGGVIIEDDVEIGANVTIDRAVMGQTIIGQGTKFDNLVQVGHNVKIGAHSILVAQVGISGSSQLGNYVTLAGQVGVAGHVKIGDQVIVGAKSGVTKDIPAAQTVSGFPPVPHKSWLKSQVALQQLPSLRSLVNELKRRVTQLEDKRVREKNDKEMA